MLRSVFERSAEGGSGTKDEGPPPPGLRAESELCTGDPRAWACLLARTRSVFEPAALGLLRVRGVRPAPWVLVRGVEGTLMDGRDGTCVTAAIVGWVDGAERGEYPTMAGAR